MDKVVKVRRSFLNEVRGFLNIFAQACSGCFHRPCDCENHYVISRAKNLMRAIDGVRDAKEETFFIENPSEELFVKIEVAIKQAKRAVRSEEIFLAGVYRQRKAWALKTMTNKRRLSVSVVDGIKYYDLVDKMNTNKKETH